MKASFIILGLVSIAVGEDITYDVNSETRAWTGWDPKVRSTEEQAEAFTGWDPKVRSAEGQAEAFTGWDPKVRSAEGQAEAFTGWDPKVRSAKDREGRAWTGWDVKSRSMEDSEEEAFTGWDISSRSVEDNREARVYTGWDIASRNLDESFPSRTRSLNSMVKGINDLLVKGRTIKNDVRDELKTELRARLTTLVQKANETINYYCQNEGTGNYTCSVCAALVANNNLCSNLIIDTANISATINIKLNNLTLITRSIGVKQPPPICVPLPHLPMFTFCLRAYDIDFSLKNTDNFKGCLEAQFLVGVYIWSESMDFPLICMKHDEEGFHFNRTSPTKPTKKPSTLSRLFKN